MIDSDNVYELGWLPPKKVDALQESFNHLPFDTYVQDRLRSRRYSCYYYRDGKLEHLPQKHFMQTKKINKALGDVERQYEEIDRALDTEPAFLKIFEEFKNRTNLPDDSVIEVHQIRWHCKRHVKELAPEGVHQDGFDYIGMFMVNTYNVDGGEIMLYESLDAAPCFKKNLGNGEFAVVNDRVMFHNASPLVPTPNDKDGHWDMFVLTANKTA